MFHMIISGGGGGDAQRLTGVDLRGWSCCCCCESEGKLRDDQKMLTRGESAAVKTNTRNNTHASWILYKLHLKSVKNQNLSCVVQKLSAAHYTLQSFNLSALWRRTGTSVAAPRLLGDAGQLSHAVRGHPELD